MHPWAIHLIVAAVGAIGVLGHPGAAGATTPAVRFWEEALPGTPVPDAIADLVQKGIDHSPLADHYPITDDGTGVTAINIRWKWNKCRRCQQKGADKGFYFLKTQVRVGSTMTFSFRPALLAPILPHDVAEKVPFGDLANVLATFNVAPSSAEAATVKDTLGPPRSSPREVREEMARCFDLVRRLGRGAVYLGSSRVPPTHPHFLQTTELAREIARLLDCTTWTGAGPGLMDAAIQGALEADKPVGGLKIAKEAGEWTSSNFHSYLTPETYVTCRFFSARKHGLVDAAVRSSPTDRTAVVALPGGVGTLDELFEIMALIQLERIGSALPVPFLLLNYDSYYSKLLDFLNDCQEWGTVAPGEVASLWKVCDGNHEALEYLAEFYNVPHNERKYQMTPQLKNQRVSYATS